MGGPLLLTLAGAAAGLALLYFGGEGLVRGASGLAARLGVSPLAIGLTAVAFGTSAPELVVSLDAALGGANDIAVGNVVGSNIANIALILGLAVLLAPAIVQAKIVRIDAPLVLLVSLLLLAVLADARAGRLEGGLLLAGLVAYTAFTFWEARREAPAVQAELAGAAPPARAGAGADALRTLAGLAMLVAGGHLLVTAAVALATGLGVSQAVIGLTIVAVGTSLPELATSLVAAARGQRDIAVGNVVGSNLFNILGILGVTALVQPLGQGAITWADLGVMTVLAGGLALRLGIRPALGRHDGALLLAAFAAYTAWLLLR
ncbi:MAG: calcium/sodium antiporter [Halofilum sp. (in: g-proteobacteria)]|nr:calcium/sodium antiporter [Halofilum sp. (in: g-proteobacteria)]